MVGTSEEASNQNFVTNTDGSASSDNSTSAAGAAYVFKRDGSGNWIQDAYLKSSNSETGDNFGFSLAISSTTIVVGARSEDSNQTIITNTDGAASSNNSSMNAGAAYVFKRDSGGDWVQDAYLKASNAEIHDLFGYTVSISGSTIVVATDQEDSNQTTITNTDNLASPNNTFGQSGAIYVFKRDAAGNWIQDAYLKVSNAQANDAFGRNVAISGSIIVAGAYGEDSNQTTITNTDDMASSDNSAANSGAAYVFKAFP